MNSLALPMRYVSAVLFPVFTDRDRSEQQSTVHQMPREYLTGWTLTSRSLVQSAVFGYVLAEYLEPVAMP